VTRDASCSVFFGYECGEILSVSRTVNKELLRRADHLTCPRQGWGLSPLPAALRHIREDWGAILHRRHSHHPDGGRAGRRLRNLAFCTYLLVACSWSGDTLASAPRDLVRMAFAPAVTKGSGWVRVTGRIPDTRRGPSLPTRRLGGPLPGVSLVDPPQVPFPYVGAW